MQFQISNLKMAFLCALCVLCGSLPLRAAEKVSIALNWVPEPEFGGIYAAQQNGAYQKRGLEVTIKPGGAGAPTWQQVASGRAASSRRRQRDCAHGPEPAPGRRSPPCRAREKHDS